MLHQQIGAYRIIELLGEGGMAHVYLAEKGNLGKKVALKVLKKEFLFNSQIRGRFLAEAKNMIQLNHPNIVAIHDLIDEPDFVAIELEYVDGETLKDYLQRKGALPDDEIEKFLRQMLDAVNYIHKKGFVHRDIKPSNFMLTDSGIIKLADFGIAKNTEGTTNDYTGTGTGMVLGTPKYMSPEQVRNTKDVTAQSDIYSLGVVLWEMVTGRVPYNIDTESTFDVLRKIVDEPLAKTGTKWDSLIEDATRKNSVDRKLEFKSQQANPIGLAKEPNHKAKKSSYILGGLIVLLICGGVWLINNSKEEYSKTDVSGNPTEEAIPEWKKEFEEQWELAEQAENNKKPDENVATYTNILETLPYEAIDEKNMVQQKIDHFKILLTEADRIAEEKRIQEELQKERERNGDENKKSGTFTDSRDGKTYKWVRIGDQIWMAENLAYRPSSGNYWAYDNNSSNVAKYGYLYDWKTACKVCPEGWYLPSDADWNRISEHLGGRKIAGHKLKSTWGWKENGNGGNESGFNSLPSGLRDYDGLFIKIGETVAWWSSEEHNTNIAYNRLLNYSSEVIFKNGDSKTYGYSVRCIRD